jgi:hypothetical protein
VKVERKKTEQKWKGRRRDGSGEEEGGAEVERKKERKWRGRRSGCGEEEDGVKVERKKTEWKWRGRRRSGSRTNKCEAVMRKPWDARATPRPEHLLCSATHHLPMYLYLFYCLI